ncbi:MAG: site-specific integrase [Candidatus Micrarchaeia archaeon]
MKAAIKILSSAKRRRYPLRSESLYGDLWLAPDQAELNKIMDALPPKHRLLHAFQLCLAISILQACQLKTSDFMRDNGWVYTRRSKVGNRLTPKPVPDFLRDWMLQYVEINRNEIENSGGYLFTKHRDSRSNWPHLSPDYARKVLRKACARAGANDVYGIGRDGQERHRIGTHSFKRFGISAFGEETQDAKLTQALSGHKSVEVMMRCYWKAKPERVREASNKVFSKILG